MQHAATMLALAGLALSAPAAFAGEIRGRVLDAAGAPVPNARVLAAENTVAQILYSTPKGAFAVSASETDAAIATEGKLTGETATDAEGRFTVPNLRAARFTLLALEPERGFALHQDTEVGSTLDLTLAPGATVTGRVKGLRLDRTKHVLQLKPRTLVANIVFTPNIDLAKDDGFRFGPLPDLPGWNLMLTEWVIERGFSSVLVTEPVDVAAGKSVSVTVDLDRDRRRASAAPSQARTAPSSCADSPTANGRSKPGAGRRVRRRAAGWGRRTCSRRAPSSWGRTIPPRSTSKCRNCWASRAWATWRPTSR
jgi:hypothetical protein